MIMTLRKCQVCLSVSFLPKITFLVTHMPWLPCGAGNDFAPVQKPIFLSSENKCVKEGNIMFVVCDWASDSYKRLKHLTWFEWEFSENSPLINYMNWVSLVHQLICITILISDRVTTVVILSPTGKKGQLIGTAKCVSQCLPFPGTFRLAAKTPSKRQWPKWGANDVLSDLNIQITHDNVNI